MRPSQSCEQEAGLIERLQRRDPTALGELYDVYGRSTYGLIQRIVQDEGVAEDLVQETFLRVWTSVRLFDSRKGAMGAWLLTIARNRAVDYVRSAHGRRRRDCQRLDETKALECIHGSGRISAMPQKVSLGKALGKLSGKQRAAIDLAYFEGYSQAEIAAKLGHPLGTVKTWVRTALEILRTELRASPTVKSVGEPYGKTESVTARSR